MGWLDLRRLKPAVPRAVPRVVSGQYTGNRMKDNFSTQASSYARFRPGYPAQLFDFLYDLCRDFNAAWDCATGNGQIAGVLAERFETVEATDISEKQVAQAVQKNNIRYSIEAAETPSFPDAHFDLVTVGQSAHWFDFDRFYPQAIRVLKPGGILALVGYNLLQVDGPVDVLIKDLYSNTLGLYWDVERKHVDAAYASIPFPFSEIPLPEMQMEYEWTVEHLLGYLQTWSALQHYIRKNGDSPLQPAFLDALKTAWPEAEVKTVKFPIFGRITRKAL